MKKLATHAALAALAAVTLARTAFGQGAVQERPNPHGALTGNCGVCHTADRWTPARIGKDFEHTKTFPLVGAHATVPCRSCHVSLEFNRVSTACVDCHQDVHGGELGTDCTRCHTTRNFIERAGEIRSHRTTRFPLRGAHVTVDCDQCHRAAPQGQLSFLGTPVECIACHDDRFRTVTSPDHVAANFPTDCTLCHSTIAWSPSRFDHASVGFPLRGAHAGATCTDCHTNGRFDGLSVDCYSCHRPQYEAAADPNHVAAGFTTTCADCHTVRAWSPATFNHASTGFPLTGAHSALACSPCHINGQYQGTPTDCYACHQTNYQQTTDPNHTLAGFSTDCARCHTTTMWSGATFDHDTANFPIYSGSHRSRWQRCSDCHTNLSNFGEFSCFGCHPHSDRANTDSHHHDVLNYAYDSNRCYECHPRGRVGN